MDGSGSRFRRLADSARRHAWFAVAVDLVVVIAGILIALEVNDWAQRRNDRTLERGYLERLKVDFQIERTRMDAAERYATSRIDAARLLDRLAADPAAAAGDSRKVSWALETSTWRSFPQLNAFVYRELQSTGRLALIRSESLRRSLAEHYTAFQHDARVGEDLSAQQRFEAAVAGLLTVDEAAAVEGAAGRYESLEMRPERASALARAFASRPAAVVELPGIVQHHIFNLRVIAQARERADAIARAIDAQLAQ